MGFEACTEQPDLGALRIFGLELENCGAVQQPLTDPTKPDPKLQPEQTIHEFAVSCLNSRD